MVSGIKTLALYLTVALEDEYYNATKTWVGMFKNTPCVCEGRLDSKNRFWSTSEADQFVSC